MKINKLKLLIPIFATSIMMTSCIFDPDEPTSKSSVDLNAATSPNPSDFSQESTLMSRYDSIMSFYNSHPAQYFTGAAGVKIHYRVFKAANSSKDRAIVFLTGRSESIAKYSEMIQDLVKMGYSVYTYDHRGQGASGRMLSNPEIGYVEFFKDYVTDMETFVNNVVLPKGHKNLFLAAHSMGGAVSSLYMYKHPNVFKATVLNSPMIAANTAPYPFPVASALSLTDCGWGKGDGYALGQVGYDDTHTFTDSFNDVTHSEPRFDFKMKLLNEDKSLRLGGVSYRWLCQTLKADGNVRGIADSIQTPILLLKAGDDKLVQTKDEDKFCSDAPHCQMHTYPNGWHEGLNESDDIRNDAMTKLVRYFDSFSGGR